MTKFAKIDDKYKTEREILSSKHFNDDIWRFIDKWPLFVGLSNLARNINNIDLIRSTIDVPGDVAEFGSWNGANLMLLAKVLKLESPYCNKIIHSFDSFEGLTTFDEKDGKANENTGSYAGDLEVLLDIIKLYEMSDDIEIHKGLIQDTLPKFLEDNPQAAFSLIYADTDLYEPTTVICELLMDHLMPGGLIVFDEWNDARWPGEGIAANEFLRKYSDYFEVQSVKMSRQPNLVLRKTKM